MFQAQVNILQENLSFAKDHDSGFHFLPKEFLASILLNLHFYGKFVAKILKSGDFGKILGKLQEKLGKNMIFG